MTLFCATKLTFELIIIWLVSELALNKVEESGNRS
jgi:hypothetical protein